MKKKDIYEKAINVLEMKEDLYPDDSEALGIVWELYDKYKIQKHRIAILERALELAWYHWVDIPKSGEYPEDFIKQAELEASDE